MPTLEADDVLGVLATNPHTEDDMIICSVDKDFKTLANVRFFDLNTEETTISTEEEARLFFYSQILSGDAVDGYKGCPTIGPKTADKILRPHLKSPADMWEAVVATYEKKAKLDRKEAEAEALVNARMARILRFQDWDQTEQAPILWQPPS